jgi:hypothetical protein
MRMNTHINDDIVSWKLPRIKVEPVIWNLNLVSIDNLLLEDSISVSQSITPGWKVQGSHRVQEAGSETTETTISECSIMFLINDVLDTEAKICQTICRKLEV